MVAIMDVQMAKMRKLQMNLRKNGNKYLIFIEIVALIIVLVYGALHFVIPSKSKDVKNSDGQVADGGISSENTSEQLQSQEEELVQVTYSDTVNAKVQEMTVEEKVSQLFITRPEEITGVNQFTQAGNKTKAAIETYPIGGFVFSNDNFGGVAATQTMMNNVQQYANERIGVQMLLAVNEVGGDTSPLASKNAYNVETNPIDWQSVDNATAASGNMAWYIKDSALNTDFAPVANLAGTASDGENVQTFGDDVELAADMVGASVSKYSENGVYTVARTFPGNNIDNPDEQLKPFKSAVDAGISFIMIGNYPCESITGDGTTPCSTSSNAVDYIRNNLKYSGALMTADLSTGISDGSSQDDAAVAAVKAGVDMIYISTGFEGSYNAVLNAVNNGDISQEQLDDAVSRILTSKGM